MGRQRWHPDFLLPDLGLYIEYYGLAGQPDYDRGIEEKTKAYADAGLQVIPVYPQHVKNEWPTYLAEAVINISRNRARMAEAHLAHVYNASTHESRYW